MKNVNLLKGRVAEAIVENLFEEVGYTVYRFGMESTLPGFMKRKNPKTGEVAQIVRKMPDFIIEKNSKTRFIEVKYLTGGEEAFDFKKACCKGGEKYPYPNAYIVLVTPRIIKIQKASVLEEGGKKFMWLTHCKGLDLTEDDKEVIGEYAQTCKDLFGHWLERHKPLSDEEVEKMDAAMARRDD